VSEEIVVTSEEMAHLARFHWPERRFVLYPARKVVADRHNAAQLAASLPRTEGGRTIYMVGREWLSDPDGALQSMLRTQYEACPSTYVRGIQIMCLLERKG
jgi:hypothetical protein